METAFVVPVIFLFLFTSIEIGRAYMAFHSLELAAHDGCRTAILAETTFADVESSVQDALDKMGITGYTVTMDPASLDNVEQFAPVTVSVTVPYSNISWLPSPTFLSELTVVGNATLPREGGLSSPSGS